MFVPVSSIFYTVTWSAFGMVTRVEKDLRAIDLVYGPDRARFKRVDTSETGITTTHYVAGGALSMAKRHVCRRVRRQRRRRGGRHRGTVVSNDGMTWLGREDSNP